MDGRSTRNRVLGEISCGWCERVVVVDVEWIEQAPGFDDGKRCLDLDYLYRTGDLASAAGCQALSVQTMMMMPSACAEPK